MTIHFIDFFGIDNVYFLSQIPLRGANFRLEITTNQPKKDILWNRNIIKIDEAEFNDDLKTLVWGVI